MGRLYSAPDVIFTVLKQGVQDYLAGWETLTPFLVNGSAPTILSDATVWNALTGTGDKPCPYAVTTPPNTAAAK